jgi:diguanylate cyclase (GGDEF)-like protein
MNKVLYRINLPEDFPSRNEESRKQHLELEMSGYFEKLYGRYRVLVGVPTSSIDTVVKEEIYHQIHNSQYSQDSYIWINQIVHYEGGENYAIRLIHPNLKDTEGSYLSTATKDVAGGTPYLTELEGVRDHGSIFYQYHFKKMNSDVISEKVAYARLYPDYDWVIAMGIHLDDIDAYVAETVSNSHQAIFKTLMVSLIIIAGLMILATFTASRMEKWYYNRSYSRLMKEAYRDSLTGIFNRKAGEQFLHSSFEKFGLSGVETAVLILDLDDFKKINDHCGHQRGDEVLIQFTQAVGNSLRSTDVLVRWGGEEFLLICEGLKAEDTKGFTDKILEAARTVTYSCSDDQIQVLTTSIGLSFFHPMDKGPDEAVRRADEAMYDAKAKGKNQASEK